jgi:indolepyruvate decarboxylase
MYRQFQDLSAASACVVANLTPQNAIAEMERVIAEALTQRRPAYITVAEDDALLPVIGTPVSGTPLARVPRPQSDPASLDAAIGRAPLDHGYRDHRTAPLPGRLCSRKWCYRG